MEIHITVATETDILNSVITDLQTTALSHASSIAEAIHSLGASSDTELWIAILSVLVSLGAIGVTLYTVHKQNQIALFNLRYDAFFTIFVVLQFAESVKDLDKAKIGIMLYNSYFDVSVPLEDHDTALQMVYANNKKLERTSFAAKFLFNTPDAHNLIAEMFAALNNFMAALTDDCVDDSARDALCNACTTFYTNNMQAFEKYLFVYRKKTTRNQKQKD